jgi:pimeloyl-ACP methyl ester carboxylesterase
VSRVDALWQSGVDEQVAKSFANAKARETYLPVFVHQALQIRPAFSEHNRILRDEVATRDAAVPRLGRISKPVLIAFGVSDPNLNAGGRSGVSRPFPTSVLSPVQDAAHYVQLGQPEALAKLIDAAHWRP